MLSLIASIAAATICIAGTAHDEDLAPLYCPATVDGSKVQRDGRKLTEDNLPEGFGRTRLRIAERFAEHRDKNIENAGAIVSELEELMRSLEGKSDRAGVRKKIEELSGKRLDEAEQELLEAVDLEQKRLVIMRKVIETAFKEKRTLDEVDEALIDRLLERYKGGEPEAAARQYVAGLRMVANGLLDYLDDDLVGAVSKMKTASKQCPDLAVAFMYLGSFSYMMDQPDAAVAAWRRVLEIEPDNQEVRAALKSLGITHIGSTDDKKRKKRK